MIRILGPEIHKGNVETDDSAYVYQRHAGFYVFKLTGAAAAIGGQ